MHVRRNAFACGMAVVLLGTACSSPPKVDLSGALRSLGDRSGLETIRTLLFRGEPESVRAGASIDKIKGLKAA